MTSDLPRPHSRTRPWRAGSRSIVRTAVTESELGSGSDSERVAEARARAQERLHRQRRTLRPLGWAVILVVVLGSANSHPVPGLHGKGLAVTLALCVFAVTLLIAIRDGFPERSLELQAAVIAIMGAAGVAIAGLQLKGATGVAAGVAVFMAITRLPFKTGVATGWCGDRRARCRHGDRRELVVGCRGRDAGDGTARGRRAVPQAVAGEPGPDRAAAGRARGRAR